MWAYRVGQFQNVGSVRYGATVAGVPHQGAGQEHGAEVIAVQNVHSERGRGCAPLTRVRGPVLRSGMERKLFHLFSVDVAISDLDLHISIYLFIYLNVLVRERCSPAEYFFSLSGNQIDKAVGWGISQRLQRLDANHFRLYLYINRANKKEFWCN